ncbi:HPr family phosphocarrier protein [Cryobacterium adonitolivorans]|uniref:HPr family phosphocarrier protein n=1 Tax=Cryobacterium adonitolivorans TaxID=1259189 RepID=UPI00141BAE73|nr:HPr family phosphocarrier protein [Cryobacterium adonitolivorans]
MFREQATVRLPHGVHAAIAHRLHQTASRFSSSVFLRRGEEIASLRSIVAVLALGLHVGADIEVLADGTDEVDAVAAIVGMLRSTNAA